MNRPDNLPKLDFSKYPQQAPKHPNFLTETVEESMYYRELHRMQDEIITRLIFAIREAQNQTLVNNLPEDCLTKLRDICNTEIERRKNDQ